MATLEGLLEQWPHAKRFTDAEQAMAFMDAHTKHRWHQGREVEYKDGEGKTKLTYIRLTKRGFRPIDVVVLELPATKAEEEKAA